MNDFILEFENVFDDGFCSKFIDYINLLESHSILVSSCDSKCKSDDYSTNLAYNYDLKYWSWIGEQFFPCVQKYVNNYISNYDILSFDNYLLYDVKVKKILPGGGIHVWNYDNKHYSSLNRILSIKLYLNDIEEGGETEFLYLNKRIKPQKGKIIIFPSDFTHTYRENSPINQTQYVINSWVLLQENNG
jgi:hypothetical protein